MPTRCCTSGATSAQVRAGPRPSPCWPTPGRSAVAERDVLERLERAIAARRDAEPSGSYVAALNARGLDAILKKIGEEATETVLAAKGGDKAAIVHEVADLWFHCLVMLGRQGVSVAEVLAELERREGRSGHDEKASRQRGDP